MTELILRGNRCALAFDRREEKEMAEGVKTKGLQGRELAFLTEWMVKGDAVERVAPADGGRRELPIWISP